MPGRPGEAGGVGTDPRVALRPCSPHCSPSARLTHSGVLGPEVLCGGSLRAWPGRGPSLPSLAGGSGRRRTPQFPSGFSSIHPAPPRSDRRAPGAGPGRWQGLNSARCPAWRRSNRPPPPAPRPLRCRPLAKERAGEPPPDPDQFTLFLFSLFLWLLGKNGGRGGREGRAQETGRSRRRKAWAGKWGSLWP